MISRQRLGNRPILSLTYYKYLRKSRLSIQFQHLGEGEGQKLRRKSNLLGKKQKSEMALRSQHRSEKKKKSDARRQEESLLADLNFARYHDGRVRRPALYGDEVARILETERSDSAEDILNNFEDDLLLRQTEQKHIMRRHLMSLLPPPPSSPT